MSRPHREHRDKLRVFVPPTPISFSCKDGEILGSFMFPAGGRIYDLIVMRDNNVREAVVVATITSRDNTVREELPVSGGFNYLHFKNDVRRGDIIEFSSPLVLGEAINNVVPCHISFLFELNPRSRNIKYLDLDREKQRNERILFSDPGDVKARFEIGQ